MQTINLILNTDSYKYSHPFQYPPQTQVISSYIESRSPTDERIIFFGLQAFLKEYLAGVQVTKDKIDEAEQVVTAHGLPFYREGWNHIAKHHGGRLPIRISSVAEGSLIPGQNVLLQIHNTDPKCWWLTNFLETALLRAIWYPSTVATTSWKARQIIQYFLNETSDDPKGQIDFRLHDFGFRGVSSLESGSLGGLAHLINFMGTDTIGALLAGQKYYGEEMAGFSIPAAEHSTITVWNDEHDAFENMIDQFAVEGKLFAVVSDSYDIYHAVEKLWGHDFKERILQTGATLVIRPDSGDPVEVTLKVVQSLFKFYGRSVNSKGYHVLPSAIRIIQGDGINCQTIFKILDNYKAHKVSAENISFGMGGALLQQVHRDTFKFAMKCSAAKIDGQWKNVAKKPVTDMLKFSKSGRLALIQKKDRFLTIPESELQNPEQNFLKPVFQNGVILHQTTFQEIRNRIRSMEYSLFSSITRSDLDSICKF